MAGPLDGIKVLDLSAVVSGPFTGAMLADQGADVIKVERLEIGDIQRGFGTSKNGVTGTFHVLNRGKRSIAIDLATKKGIEIVLKLAEKSDVCIQNFRPGVVDRLGVGYEDLRKQNPAIIYLSISGFGLTGPAAERGAYDPIIQAYSGLTRAQGGAEEAPVQVNQLIMDKLTALNSVSAIVSALYVREKTGTGQHIAVSMLDTALQFMWPDIGSDQILLDDDRDQRPPMGAAGQIVKFKDGYATMMAINPREIAATLKVFDVEFLLDDPRFATLEGRMANLEAWMEVRAQEIDSRALNITLDDMEQRCIEHKVPFGRANLIGDAPSDHHIAETGIFVEDDHPVAGRLRQTRPAAIFSETPAKAAGPAPTCGQHTQEILAEIGMEDEIEKLLADEIVGDRDARVDAAMAAKVNGEGD